MGALLELLANIVHGIVNLLGWAELFTPKEKDAPVIKNKWRNWVVFFLIAFNIWLLIALFTEMRFNIAMVLIIEIVLIALLYFTAKRHY